MGNGEFSIITSGKVGDNIPVPNWGSELPVFTSQFITSGKVRDNIPVPNWGSELPVFTSHFSLLTSLGTENLNSLPFPTSLFAHIFPPFFSTNSLQRISPSPVPCSSAVPGEE